MRFERNPYRVFPDGNVRKVYPFHVSLAGLESKVLCKDDEDYDVFVKILVVCALKAEVFIVVYTIVSNHLHVIVLADSQETVGRYGNDLKKRYSMHLQKKYGDVKTLKRVDVAANWIDSDWYFRNAAAYVLRNAFDNGARRLDSYEWCSYGAYFCSLDSTPSGTPVKSLNKRDKARMMHTCEDLSSVPWMLDGKGRIIPFSVCEWKYFETAFDDSPVEMLKRIGQVNMPEMNEKLVVGPRTMKQDGEFLRFVNDISNRWFNKDVNDLPAGKKIRLVAYTYRTTKTTAAQLSRVFEMKRDVIRDILSQMK